MDKEKTQEMQKKLEETFPVIASGSYVRPFAKSCICHPLNWGYVTDKAKETIKWEYRFNSKKLPFFMYREKYSYTTIQAHFFMGHANERAPDIGSMYLDKDELAFNQSKFDSQMNTTSDFRQDYLIIQPEVESGDMLENICKFDRKLGLALTSLRFAFEGKTPVKKIPIERMFEPVVRFLAIPFIAEYNCAGTPGLPPEKEILEYARPIWNKIDF